MGLLITLACELLLAEIQNERDDEAVTIRIKAMVERILAKSKQSNATVKNLVSCVYGQSPKP